MSHCSKAKPLDSEQQLFRRLLQLENMPIWAFFCRIVEYAQPAPYRIGGFTQNDRESRAQGFFTRSRSAFAFHIAGSPQALHQQQEFFFRVVASLCVGAGFYG